MKAKRYLHRNDSEEPASPTGRRFPDEGVTVNKMASGIVAQNGVARCVYDDRMQPIVRALPGTIDIERATEVEYSPDSQRWVAVFRPTGEVIASGPLRSAVLPERSNDSKMK